MKYQVDGLRAIITEQTQATLTGKMRVRYLNFIPDRMIFPSVVTATVLMVRITDQHWVLQHIMIDDDDRGKGWCEKIVLSIEAEHGHFGAIWCSACGEAFARKFVRNHGERPLWRIGAYSDEQIARLIQMAEKEVCNAR